MAVEIDVLGSADATVVIDLWNRCGLTRPWNDPGDDIARAFAAPDATILVGRLESVIVASIMAGYDGHRGWVYYLAVDPDHARRGIGTAMMDAAEIWLKARGAPKIQLMVRDGNAEAIAFYEAIGLEVQPVVTLGKRLDAG